MAVRFTAGTDRLHRTVSLGSKTAYTITGWFQITVDRNAFSTFWSINNAADVGTGAHILQATGDGTSIVVWSTNQAAVVSATVGTWYFIGISANGANWTGRVRALGAGSFTNVSGTNLSNPSTFNQIRFGESHYTNEQLDGRIEALKIWNVALTGTEMEAEYPYRKPVKVTDVLAYYKWTTSNITDDSGNGWTLTATGTVDIEAGPAGIIDEASTPISVSESGSSAEALSVTSTVPIGDSASASESLTIARAALLNDSASSIEALAASVALVLGETGSETENLTIARAINLNDSGLTGDTLTLNATTSITDTGLSAEGLSVSSLISVSDAATATESITVSRTVPLADTASGTDALGVSQALMLTDAGTGADALTAAPLVSLADTGTAQEAATASALVALGDSAGSSLNVAVSAAIPLADTASASESLLQGAAKTCEDSGQATESLAVSVALSVEEGAYGLETFLKDYAEILLTDYGFASETLTGGSPGVTPGSMAYAELLTPAMAFAVKASSQTAYTSAVTTHVEQSLSEPPRMEGGS